MAVALAVALAALLALVLLAGAMVHDGRWSSAARCALLALVWVTLSLPFVALRDSLRPWYSFIPLTGVALLLASVAHAATDLLVRRRFPARAAGACMLVACTAIVVPSLAHSPVYIEYQEWPAASRLLANTTADLEAKLKHASPGQRVGIGFVTAYRSPSQHRKDPARSTSVVNVRSLQAWCRLAFPGKRIRVLFRQKLPPWYRNQDEILVLAQERRGE